MVLPRNAKEFQEMLELVLYNPSAYSFHHRFREALVDIQKPNYSYLEQSKEGGGEAPGDTEACS